ncbi:flavin-containing monooxygenase [Actinomarinicola tropica]|uniref:NAD(P)-binding protein n=1 Tax=Actinomarinicola tropica TaxID=2789776 RepID=A0A5Q2RQK0_9ACTN|nr:NAD(P)/FAD-dependent oxidoreductase [Actinomarinicola tropica]QGG96417.1 NAD(P)-binding protein [Actinomarinicola tropica]
MTTAIDKDALKRRYAEERDKRLRADGNAQYLRLEGQLSHYAEDPYTPFVEREPVHDHVTVAFIGAGFAGLVTGARLREAGIDDVRLVEKGGDVGGTWYWNRYPGAQCDTASMVYMPLLEETGHMPSEKYAHAPEILEHCQRIARHYDLYDHALFHTEVTALEWHDDRCAWLVRTNQGDEFTATFLAMGTGPLHVPKLPGIPGIEDFRGHSFHTSRWDYDYTGGSPDGDLMDGLADKRVGIIGTGATSVQCVPHLARSAAELVVFQRTPSSVDVRANHPIDPDWFAEIATPGWQKRWLENFTANQTGAMADEDLVQDGWTDLARRMRSRVLSLPPEEMTAEGMMAALEDADFEKMEEIRARVDAVVEDPATAQKLKAWYRQLCKRPCFHDEYLQAFNRPNVRLVDTDGRGVDRITERGVVVGEVEHELDCLIYASGFEVGSAYTERAGYDPVGRDGVRLSEYWANGMRTLHGIHVHGFPNLFIVQPTQGANLISNVPHNLTESGTTIAAIVRHALDTGASRVEVTEEAEQAWIELLRTGPGRGVIGSPDCTPGYYNNEGQEPPPHARDNVGYPHGAMAYFAYLDDWRTSGRFKGLTFD